MSDSPMEVMDKITDACRDLDTIGRELAHAITDLAVNEQEYHRRLENAKLELFDEHRARQERMPAEDLRTAMAHRRIGNETYGAWLTSKAQVDALRARARCIESALSARQSLLGAMRAEMAGAA